MKTNGSPRTARKLSAYIRLIIVITALPLMVSMLGVNAFMQEQKTPARAKKQPVIQVDRENISPVPGYTGAILSANDKGATASVGEAKEGKEASASVGVVQEKNAVSTSPATATAEPTIQMPARASVGATSYRLLTPGTCDTAGAIEVESSGGTAAGTPTPYATLGAAFTAIN